MIDFAAIDFETANGKRSSVCSVGVVIARGGQVTETIHRLIRPTPDYYAWFCTNVHGMTARDTRDAPPFPRRLGGDSAEDRHADHLRGGEQLSRNVVFTFAMLT